MLKNRDKNRHNRYSHRISLYHGAGYGNGYDDGPYRRWIDLYSVVAQDCTSGA